MSQIDMALPPIAQPKGLKFLLGTWTGRLILVNSLVFILMVWKSQSLMAPTSEVLLQFGAKDPVLIAQGEFWRFLTPIFVHIGIIHFSFNTMGLFYVGYQLEALLGPMWFLAIYLLSGTFGNIASGVFNTALSAGASGSLFGLLGCGFLVERLVGHRIEAVTGQRPKQKIYASMVITNLVFGILIPGIDNGAHLGGMIAGIGLTLVMLLWKPNQLRTQNKRTSAALAVLIALLALAGGILASSPKFVATRFNAAIHNSKTDQEKFARLSQALRLSPLEPRILVARARLLAINGEIDEAKQDLVIASKSPGGPAEILSMLREIESEGYAQEAEILRQLFPEERPI